MILSLAYNFKPNIVFIRCGALYEVLEKIQIKKTIQSHLNSPNSKLTTLIFLILRYLIISVLIL